MPSQKKPPISARAYISDAIPMPLDEQRAMCRDAIAALDGVQPLTAIYGPREIDALIREVGRTEVVVLARLLVLGEKPPPARLRIGAAFLERVGELEAASLYVLDVVADLRSDRAGWREHRRATHNVVTNGGRTLPTPRAKKMQRASAASPNRKRVVEHWRAMEGTGAHRRVRQHWMDPQHENAEAAIASAPEEAESLSTMSVSTWTAIFGGRTGRTNKRAKKQ